MIHSTVNASDADAMSRHIDMFFDIFGQLIQDTLQWATLQRQKEKPEDALRIWMSSGKDERVLRQVFGPMANGQHRNDLTPERMRILLDALQLPEIENIDPTCYHRRRPAIEIKIGETTLYRQERDGVVTVNEIQQQKQRLTDLDKSDTQNLQRQPSHSNAAVVARKQIEKLPGASIQNFLRSLVQNGVNWLSKQAQRWHHQAIAQAALQAFQRGYDSTKESTYQVGDFWITQQGKNQYSLSDASGDLMRLRETRKGVKVLSVSDRLSPAQFQATLHHLNQLPTQGSHEAEYAFKVRATEQTVRDFLSFMKTPVWDAERGKFRLELTEDGRVLIFSKQDSRGQVHGRPKESISDNHSVTTRLTWQDFEHFDELKQRLEQHQTRQSENITPVHENGKNGATKQKRNLELE